jgi:DNA-directed RNA polymerase specialized sigma subunit
MDGASGSKDPRVYKRFADYFADIRVLKRRNRAQFAIKLGITIDDVRDLEHGVLPDETLIKRFAKTFLRPDHSYKHMVSAFPSLRPNELARQLRDRCLEFQHLPKADPVRRRMENAIIEECMPMAQRIAKSVAGRYRRSDLAEDILGLGLVLAVRDHDPRRGYLPGFLWVRIKGVARRILWSGMQTGVTKALRNHGLMVREREEFLLQDFGRHPTEAEIAQHLDVKVEVVREVNQALLASDTLLTDDFELLLQDVVGMSVATRLWVDNDDVLVARFRRLSPSEQELLFLFYYDQFPPPEIARLTGLPEPTISTDIKWAVAKLTNG